MIAEQTEPTIFAESGDLDSLIEEACRLHDEAVAAFDAGHNYMGKFAGWFDQSEACYRRALAVLEKQFGPESAQSASLYHNLGGLEHARGRYEAAVNSH